MSFLDNLESNLKALESQDQGGIDESKRREADRERAIAAAPWAEQLKNGPFAPALIQQAIRAGHTRRTKVHLAWIGTTLRLEARGQRLELRPMAGGVDGVMLDGEREVQRDVVDLGGSPESLIGIWMGKLDAQRLAEEQSASPPSEDFL
jgi:hypothetical protein